ncbi:AraC family transcriptional regulator [Cytobacillus spongiae]|uniref:helix-turn-helix transcriptional regulator n=1 Tax=Cytobacillus spongiae TaxID=2901381 RepID=UPI001F18A0B4|nr:AraC family transcriptional regulator [Cytobacillus spongiae]UII57574.1 AraC family transcriptional regulator [Cytobacillus spongiae]
MIYSPVVQKTISHIESNLQEVLSLDLLADEVGFSRFHYHRVFQREVGVSIAEYIRYRRIANAASLLLYTDRKIIDIAFLFLFESQEAFTRAFKKYYGMPPGQYRKVMSKLTFQKEEGPMKNEQLLKGWELSGSHPFHYKMGIDREVFHRGNASGVLESVTAESPSEFATMMQQFKSTKYKGKRLKLSGFLKSEQVEGFCGFWMRIDDALGDVLQFDNMSNRPIIGSCEWNHYQVVLDVPEKSELIAFGVLLSGSGKVWIDDLRFEEVDENTPSTNLNLSTELLEEPTNLSFEE